MINLKQLLLKLSNRNLKIGEASDSFFNLVYPVNSVVITQQNYTTSDTNHPNNCYGGTWELIHKDFSNASWEDGTSGGTVVKNVMTLNTTNWNWGNYSAVIRRANAIWIRIRVTNKQALNSSSFQDNDVTIATPNLTALGCTNYLAQVIAIASDGNQMTGLGRLINNKIHVIDWVGNGTQSSFSSNTAQTTDFTCVMYPVYTEKDDSACNRFYWKRVA